MCLSIHTHIHREDSYINRCINADVRLTMDCSADECLIRLLVRMLHRMLMLVIAGGVAVHEPKNFSKYSQFFLVCLWLEENDWKEAAMCKCAHKLRRLNSDSNWALYFFFSSLVLVGMIKFRVSAKWWCSGKVTETRLPETRYREASKKNQSISFVRFLVFNL